MSEDECNCPGCEYDRIFETAWKDMLRGAKTSIEHAPGTLPQVLLDHWMMLADELGRFMRNLLVREAVSWALRGRIVGFNEGLGHENIDAETVESIFRELSDTPQYRILLDLALMQDVLEDDEDEDGGKRSVADDTFRAIYTSLIEGGDLGGLPEYSDAPYAPTRVKDGNILWEMAKNDPAENAELN